MKPRFKNTARGKRCWSRKPSASTPTSDKCFEPWNVGLDGGHLREIDVVGVPPLGVSPLGVSPAPPPCHRVPERHALPQNPPPHTHTHTPTHPHTHTHTPTPTHTHTHTHPHTPTHTHTPTPTHTHPPTHPATSRTVAGQGGQKRGLLLW
jgi:hypothetical protein